MRPLRYSINVTLDGSCDHTAVIADAGLHQHWAEALRRNDAMLMGRVTYGMMEGAWRPVAASGEPPDWGEAWMVPFAREIDAIRKYVVSSQLETVDWNAELLRGDLGEAVRRIKEQPGKGIMLGGVTLPKALGALGLIDEYELTVHPVIAGRGPRLLEGLQTPVQLRLVGRSELSSGAQVLRYEAVR